MRKYKFRAWDKEAKIMYRVFGIDVNHVTPFVDEKYINKVDILAIPPMREQTVLMQYTGQKDKNGFEIYEGDILQTTKKRKKRKFVVRWNNDIGKYVNVPVDENEISYPCFNTGTLKSLEKIGNIFENPELIETGGKQISLEVAE